MSASQTIAAGQLRSFIERIERLEEEKKTIADDIKDVKAEAKGCGFDIGAINAILKLRKMDPSERQEKEAVIDIYKAALGMLPLEEYAARDESSDTAKLIETVATGMQAEIGRKALVTALDIMIDAETGEITNEPEVAAEVSGDYLREPDAADQGQIIQEGDAPRETDRLGGDASCLDTELQMDRATEGSFETGSEAAEKGREAIPAGPEGADLSHAGVDESSAADERYVEATVEQRSSAPNSNPQPTPSPEADMAGDVSPRASSATIYSPAALAVADGQPSKPNPDVLAAGQGGSPGVHAKSGCAVTNPDADVPAFLKTKTAADYRPNCLKPDACGASGLTHCYSCKKAMAESEVA